MKSLLPILIILACADVLFAQTRKVDDCVRRGDIYRDAQYAHPLPALKQVVAEKARRNRNTFYVSPVCYLNNGVTSTLVYWREGRALILWEPYADASTKDRRHALVWSRRFLLLDRDVVPTLADVAGSSFLLPKALARRDIRECVRYGAQIRLVQTKSLSLMARSNKSLDASGGGVFCN